MRQVIQRCDRQLATPREAPQPPDHFTGRDGLINELKGSLLGERASQVVAVCGMGGIGKTTLAGIVARLPEVEERFVDGTFWVDLQATDTMAALDRIACTYGHDVSSQTTPDSRAKVVSSILRDKRVLIVLDNASQIEEASPLLPQTPTARALVITRDENLANDISGNVILIGTLTEAEGAGLLERVIGGVADAERSKACLEITRLLGHLPLALELAGKRARKAARKAWFSWGDVLDPLREERGRLDLGSEDNTVRASFNITYARALDDAGRTLFSWLGLLSPGDLELGAAARVGDLEEPSAAEILEDLTDLSFIKQTGPRQYSLHPLLHDFAREKSTAIEASMRLEGYRRVCDYFYQRGQQECSDPRSVEDIRPILRSHHYAVAARDKERAARVYPWFSDLAVPGFLVQNGHPYTLIGMDEAELSLAQGDASVALAEFRLGESYGRVGKDREGIEHLAKALDLYKKEDWDLMVAKVGSILADSYQATGDFQNAIAHFETVLELDRKLEHTAGEGLTLTKIGDCYRAFGENERALDYYEKARAFCENAGNLRETAIALIRLTQMCWQSDPERAINYLDKAASLGTARRDGGRLGSGEQTWVISTAFSGWDGARLLIQLGDLYRDILFSGQMVLKSAADCYGRAISLAREAKSSFYESIALYQLGNLLEHLFLIPGQQADYRGAVACYEKADKLAQGMELPPGINPRERIETRIRPRLDPAEFATMADNAFNNADATIQAAVQSILLTD